MQIVDLHRYVDDPRVRARYEAKVWRGPGCHYWLGDLSSTGHGKLHTGSVTDGTRRNVLAHRLGWAIAHGGLDVGLRLRHLVCDEPSCQNIDHLRPGTAADNLVDYFAHRVAPTGPLTDARGPRGRAVAIRHAILCAREEGCDEAAAADAAAAAGERPTGQLVIDLTASATLTTHLPHDGSRLAQ